MYAKLVFTAGTTSFQAVRDITRLITDSNSGSASLSNLEFISTSTSELYTGVNSGWALHSSYSLNSGSITTTDSHYVLQGTTATGSKAKYCSIQSNGNWSTSYNNGNIAVMLSAVNSPGTARENFCAGYTGTTSTNLGSGGSLPNTIYIWAEPRKIVLYGIDGGGRYSVHAMLEAAETASTTYHSLAPQGHFHWSSLTTTGTNIWQYVHVRSVSFGDSFSFPYIKMCDSMYSYHPSWTGVVRNSGWHGATPYMGSGNNGYWAYNYGSYLDDGTTATGAINTTAGVGAANSTTCLYAPNVRFEQFGQGRMDYSGMNQVGKNSLKHLDASGNKALPLRPIVWEWPQWNADIYNFSNVSTIYWAPGGMGSSLDTVTVGSDVYHYVDYAGYASSALMIKRI